MEESKVCLACRFGSVKIEILVPETYNQKNFVKEMQNFSANLTSSTNQKPIHYFLVFGADNNSQKLNFKVDCSCILNVKKADCSKFNPKQEKNCRVKH
jgi:hypothetical protein